LVFDKKGDVLDISIGRPKKTISKELGEDIIVRVDPKKKSIVGLQYLILQNVLKNRK